MAAPDQGLRAEGCRRPEGRAEEHAGGAGPDFRVHRRVFFFSSRRRHTRLQGDWSSDVCSSDLKCAQAPVTVSIGSNVAFNHACGCTKCWKPKGALFSVVAVASRDKVAVTANAQKLDRKSVV